MKNLTDETKVTVGTGNVFADLGFRNAEEMKIKSGLVYEISKVIDRHKYSQEVAGKIMGISQAKVSRLLHGNLDNLSEKKLMSCLNKLGYDINITIKPSTDSIGHMMLSIVS